MNFSFTRISLVFATSNIYWTCALEACNLFPRSCVFSTSKCLVNDLVLERSVTAEDRYTTPLNLQ